MKITLSTNEAADMLRSDKSANWSYAGAIALVKYLEEIEEEGDEMELDVVALRCDFCEYKNLQDWAVEHCGSRRIADNKFSGDEAIREYINANGHLIEFDGGIIVSRF